MRRLLALALVFGLVSVGCDKKSKKADKKGEKMAKKSEKEKTNKEETITDKMAEEHEGDEPVPTGAIEGEPSQPVTGKEVEYAKLDGTAVAGYLSKPKKAEGKLPGVIVIQEWWGLNDNIRKMTDLLAGEGYAALAVDLYEGDVAETPKKAKSLMQNAMGSKERLSKNLQQAYDYLANEVGAPKIGVIGWCFGGGWSLQTALMLPKKIDATVIYYGKLVTDKDSLKPLSMPVIGFFGSEDSAIPPKEVKAFEQAMRDLDKDVTVEIYEGANHAFANPSGERYDAKAAADAWQKTIAFLDEHLAVEAPSEKESKSKEGGEK